MKSLFQVIMFHENAIEAEVREWMDAFEADRNSAMAILLNLFLAASGAAESLTSETAADSDAIDKLLTNILKNFDPDVQNGYPLLPKAKGRIQQKFKKNIIGFLEKIMLKSRMLEEKACMWQLMYQWLGAMSSSRFKPFRHSATFIANTIQCSLCDLLRETIHDLNVAELQLRSCTGREQQKLLEKKVHNLNEDKEELESWTDNFFEGIFIHRCRDSDSTIRAECGVQICSWMSRLKEKYMDPQYLRYVGWMLADKAANVRLEYMKGLSALLSEANISNLRLFLDRFKNRILEIASKDEDLSTRLVALEALNKMCQLDLLDEDDSKIVVSMIFETEPKIRNLAAKMIPKFLSDTQHSMVVNSFPSEAFFELNCLCKVLVTSSGSHLEQKHMETEDYEDDQDLSLSQEELKKSQERDQKELLEWLSIDWVSNDLPFGISGVNEALQSLWGTLPIVKEWRSMGEYLVSVFHESDPISLTPEEDLCLLYLFSSSIDQSLNDAKKRRAVQEEVLIITRELIKILPLLLKKYKHTFTGNYENLIETISLIKNMDFQVYMDLRMHKAFEDLLLELKFVCTRHVNTDLLLACVKALPNVFSKDQEESSSDGLSQTSLYNHQIQETVKATIKDILVDIVFDQLIPQFNILASSSSDTAAKIESAVSLRGILTRFDIFRCELGITDYASFIGDSSFKTSSLVDILHGIVDNCLAIISVSHNLEGSSVKHFSLVIDYSIKVAMKDLFLYFKTQVYDNEIDSQKVLNEISQSAERLISICEAIITSDESDGLSIPFGLKFSCVHNLMTLLIFYNANIPQKVGSHRVLSEMVQSQIGQIIEKSLISFAILPLKPSSYSNELIKRGIDVGEMNLEIQQEISKSLVFYMQLLNHSFISPKYGSLFLKYFGLSGNETENELNNSGIMLNRKTIIVNMFGKTWNSITEMVMKSVLNHQFKDIMASQNAHHVSEAKISSTCRFLFRGVDAALELYLSGVVQSLDPVRNLARGIVSHIKNWGKYMEDSRNENLISLQSSIFTFFSKSCSNLIMHINAFNKMDAGSNRRLSMISDISFNDDHHDDDEKETLIQCQRNSLEEINAIWQIFGGIGGAIRHAFDTVGVGFSQFDDIETKLLKYMNDYQINPNESSKSWEPFWQFLQSVGKGDSRIRKHKGGVKRKTREKKNILQDTSPNAPVRRSNRARTVKVMRDDSSSEEEDRILDTVHDNAFFKASTPKKQLIVKENDDESEINNENQDLFSQVSEDGPFNQLSSIIKRKPPSEFETDDFASSPPAISKKIRY